MLVNELMLATTARVRPQDTIRRALELLRASKSNGVPVVDASDRLIGFFSRSNLFDCLLGGMALDSPIEGHFITEVVHLPEDQSYDTLDELTDWLQSCRVGQTVVVNRERRPIGLLTQAATVMNLLGRLNMQLEYYKDELYKVNGTSYTLGSIVSSDPLISTIKNQILQVARSSSTVLITGESGTGKELFAHSIHNASSRRKEPLIKVNCSAIPAELAEAELFGYEDGAFTGARKQGKPGKFELACGGTIFLDEIGDMPFALQGKLLRVIQEKEVERVGGVRTRKVDVRVIAATNRDMRRLVAEGKFREDLYFRINVIEFRIPPLRERRQDVPLLVEHFIAKYNSLFSKRVTGVTPAALEALVAYRWQGNVRELENIIERMLNYLESGLIDLKDLPEEIRGQARAQGATGQNAVQSLGEQGAGGQAAAEPVSGRSLASIELEAIHAAIARAQGNKSKAAKLLGISRSKLYEKLAQAG